MLEEELKIQIKKLHPGAVLPNYSRDGDAGLDLVAFSKREVDLEDYGYIEYGTGLGIKIPNGYAGFIFPRSSISKTGHILANSIGVIDSNYTGEIKIRFKTVPQSAIYKVGDRVAQLIIMPIPTINWEEVEELPDTNRGDQGFGSSGN